MSIKLLRVIEALVCGLLYLLLPVFALAWWAREHWVAWRENHAARRRREVRR